MKKNILLIFGGKSCEHDISIISALQVANNLDEYLYNIIPVYITKQGTMKYVKEFKKLNLSVGKLETNFDVGLIAGSNYIYKKKLSVFKKWQLIDCALVVMHGKNGEDGSLSALLNLSGIPYTCSDVAPSAICMDKYFFKTILKQLDCPVIDGLMITENEFFSKTQDVIKRVEDEIGFPAIIKPCNLGSSIGIKVCKSKQELANCIEFGLKFDKKVIIEEFLPEITEINVAIFKHNDELICSQLEQPIAKDDILSFNNKYISNSKNGCEFLQKKMQPKLPKKVKDEIINVAKLVYEKLDFKGVVRFDFILNKNNNNVFLNEANSIPGSLSNYLFEKNNLSFSDQLNMQIDEGIMEFNKQNSYISYFESSVLKGINFKKFNK